MSASQSKTLRFTRHFKASQEAVFRAWTDPQQLTKWWGANGFTTPFAEIDLKVNGKYRIAMQPRVGPVQYLIGIYVEVKPPERLVMTWMSQGSLRHDGYESLLTVEFIPRGAATTEVVLTHERLPDRYVGDFDAGWISTFEHLDEYLQAKCTEHHP
jgi:uncharacterized protein YndB with AHSA1/START domain